MIERRPLVCLVTDRRRLRVLGERAGQAAAPLGPLVDLLGLAADAGIDLLQVREPDLSSRDLLSLVSRAVARVAGTRSLLIVNDRADVALAAGARGVHLKGESMPTGHVRAVVPDGVLVGRSVHTREEAVEAANAGADYLIFGTVFETRSKTEGHPAAGLDRLRAVVESVSVPVLAIGGVTIERLPDVAATGAAGAAAIGLFHDVARLAIDDEGSAATAARVRAHLDSVVAAASRAFS